MHVVLAIVAGTLGLLGLVRGRLTLYPGIELRDGAARWFSVCVLVAVAAGFRDALLQGIGLGLAILLGLALYWRQDEGPTVRPASAANAKGESR